MPLKDSEARKAYTREYHRAYYARNRDAILAKNKAWREVNPERSREHTATWRKANPERMTESHRRWIAKNPDWEREWRAAHPEKVKATQRQYYATGGREKNREWAAANPDKVRAYRTKYRKNNLHKMVDKENRRRARMMGNGYEAVDRLAIYERDGGVCHICAKHVPVEVFTLDHLDPIAKGGAHVETNLRVAHRVCNSRRGAGRLPAQLLLV